MDEIYPLFAALVIVVAMMTALLLWARRPLRIKLSALLLAALAMGVGYAGLADLLSRPKPVSLEWTQRAAEEATVLRAVAQEGQAIYLWLQLPDASEPRAYSLPWSRELAQQLQNAQREAEGKGTEVAMRQPFGSLQQESEPVFYALPQPALPSKRAPEPARQLRHPSQGA